MNREKVEQIVEEKLNELELEEFAQETANIIIDLKHKIEDLEELINDKF